MNRLASGALAHDKLCAAVGLFVVSVLPSLPCSWLASPIIEDDYLVTFVFDNLHVSLVRRVFEIGCQVLLVSKSDDEAVRKTFRLALLADVGAVLEANDRVDLLGQPGTPASICSVTNMLLSMAIPNVRKSCKPI